MIQAIEHLNPDTLSAFVDGELPDGEQEAIQQHLAGCHVCALRVLSATELKAALNTSVFPAVFEDVCGMPFPAQSNESAAQNEK